MVPGVTVLYCQFPMNCLTQCPSGDLCGTADAYVVLVTIAIRQLNPPSSLTLEM